MAVRGGPVGYGGEAGECLAAPAAGFGWQAGGGSPGVVGLPGVVGGEDALVADDEQAGEPGGQPVPDGPLARHRAGDPGPQPAHGAELFLGDPGGEDLLAVLVTAEGVHGLGE